jgi:hypothetical protein
LISYSEDSESGGVGEVLDRRFLNLSRPRRMFRVAEMRVVISGASVVTGLEARFRLKRDRLLNREGRPLEGVAVVVSEDLIYVSKGC